MNLRDEYEKETGREHRIKDRIEDGENHYQVVEYYSDDYVEWLESKLKKEANNYSELIMSVDSKHPNETRHETALRYIQSCEKSSNIPAKEVMNKSDK